MKFTCDNCHAQYMIGDEKLGKRGVKVRCKKCQYVIILRPSGYQPGDKKNADEPSTADMTPSAEARVTLPPDALGPTTPFQTPHGHLPNLGDTDSGDMLGTSSDLGLSKEFAAMGFDEKPAAANKPRALSVNLDIAKIEPAFPDQSSPFSLGASTGGGSLDDEPSEDDADPKAGLAASLPRLHADSDDSDEQTSVDKTPFASSTRAVDFGDEEDSFDSTAPGHDDAPKVDLGSAAPASESFNENADDDALLTRRLAYDGGPPPKKPVTLPFDDDNLKDELAAIEKNELQDMHQSLNQSLGAEQSWGNKVSKQPPAPAARPPSSVAKPSSKPNLASLNALAAAADDPDPSPPIPAFVSPSVTAAPVAPMVHGPVHSAKANGNGASNGDAMHDGPVLDNELKSAFDAMFSPAAPATPAFQEGNLAASTVQDSAPAELFRSAYASTSSDADRRPTRVFDIEAMQQVQAEQDLASRPVSVTNGKKKTDDPEWYVAINDEQVGPLTFADVRLRWEANELAPASLCWKQGMPDWTAIKNVKELEGLGEMNDQARTVVQRVESNDDAEETSDEPPTIAHPEDDPRKQEVKTAEVKEEAEEEPSWRPSAASALASLAAAELSSDLPAEKKEKDVAVGRALPATSDALEKLLKGDSKTNSASAFGAAEMSSSSIRPLPKRADVTSSVSLRDPVLPLARQKSYVVPAAIVGGFLFLGLLLVFLLRGSPQQPAQQPLVAQVLPQPQLAQQQPAQPAQQQPQQQPQQPAQNVGQQQAAAPADTQAQPGQTQPGQAQPGQPVEVAAVVEKKETEPAKAEVAAPPAKETAPAKERTKKREREPRENKEDRPRKEEKKEREEIVTAPVEERPAVSEEDELLGGAPKKKKLVVEAPASDLPAQLEDSDILGELRKHKAAIQACRQKQAAANPGVEGTMTVTFVIEGNGRTKRWEVEPSNFKSSVVGKCVIDSVKTWNFPKFSGRPMPVDFPVRVGGK